MNPTCLSIKYWKLFYYTLQCFNLMVNTVDVEGNVKVTKRKIISSQVVLFLINKFILKDSIDTFLPWK